MLLAAVAVTALLELTRMVPARAASWLEMNFWLSGPRYDAVLPACGDGWVLSTIRSRFATKEGRFWNSDLSIAEFGEVRQVAFRPWAEATVPRRWCSGKALISDGRWRQVHYRHHRRRRHDRLEVGRRVVRGRHRPQLGLQPGLQDGAAVSGVRLKSLIGQAEVPRADL